MFSASQARTDTVKLSAIRFTVKQLVAIFPQPKIQRAKIIMLSNRTYQMPVFGIYVTLCPFNGLLPFLQTLRLLNILSIKGVNALHQATPISTIQSIWKSFIGSLCQCPSTGYFHFYQFLESGKS